MTYTELFPGSPHVGPHFTLASWFLAFGNAGLVTWEAVGGESARLASVLLVLCDTGVVLYSTGVSPLLKTLRVGCGIG